MMAAYISFTVCHRSLTVPHMACDCVQLNNLTLTQYGDCDSYLIFIP